MAKSTYTAVTRIKTGGNRYKPGDTLELDEKEAKFFGTSVQKGGRAAKPAPAKPGTATAGTTATGAAPAGDTTGGHPDPLEGVEFASPQAALKAKDFHLTSEHFKHQRKESESGFTVADVERIAEKETGGD